MRHLLFSAPVVAADGTVYTVRTARATGITDVLALDPATGAIRMSTHVS